MSFVQNNCMANKFITTILLSIIYTASFAQTTVNSSIRGKVFSAKDVEAVNATVMLHREKDMSIAKVAIANANGLFEFENLKQGNYIVCITNNGNKKYCSEAIAITNEKPAINLNSIVLEAADNNLREVTIETKKPFIERKMDRLVMNVENSILAAGSNVLEMLEKAPNIAVNQESGINLKGKSGVVIMIDGKPSPLAGTDIMNYLRALPATTLEKIEIITNPSAKYDAAGNAGIINIKFKKDQRLGFNGNATFTYGQGVYNKPSVSTNANYRTKKANLFGNYSYAHPIHFTKFDINKKFFKGDGNVLNTFDQSSYIVNPNSVHNIKVGTDFFINKTTVLGAMFTTSLNSNSRDGITTSNVYDAGNALQSTTATNLQHSGINNNYFGNINFKKTLDSLGQEITADADYGRYHSHINQNFSNINSGGSAQSSNVTNDQLSNIEVKSVKVDYTLPMKDNSKLEAGAKSSWVSTNSNLNFYINNGSNSVLDPTKTNNFLYKENINAAYINFSKEMGKTELQCGLRMEHTNTKGYQLTSNQSFERDYIQLFPNVSLSQKLNDHHQLTAAYSKRIDRPTYRQLNPLKVFVDPYTFVVGDPALNAVITHSYELTHTLNNKYITTLSYTKSKASITDVFSQDDSTKISYQVPANIQDFEQWNIGVTIPVAIGKWFNSNTSGSYYINNYSGPLQGGALQNNSNSWDVRNNSSFVIGKKGWSAELNAFYQSQSAWGLFTIKDLAQVSFGIQKLSRNKMSSLKLSFSDVFYSNRIAVVVKYQNMDFFTNRTWDSRTVSLAYNLKFGKSTVPRSRVRSTGIEDEKKRAA